MLNAGTVFSVSRLSRTLATAATSQIPGFTYLPAFLDREQQRVLAKAALQHLDDVVAPPSARRRTRRLLSQGVVAPDELGFLPETECYRFEEGHFDGVIRHYREARITQAQWDALALNLADEDGAQLGSVLHRLRDLLPPVPLQYQALHLASNGEILPHVDNVEASGSIILAVSLGSPRVLRLQDESGGSGVAFEQLLEPGSCYIQRDSVRYRYTHAILKADGYPPGQRLSIMIRDLPRAL